MDELIQIRERLLQQIEEVEHFVDAENYRQELRTSKAALKGINRLLARKRQLGH